MTFEQVFKDIQALRGIRLRSIKAGAEITIEKIDGSRLLICMAKGDAKSRPVSELAKIWNALCSMPVVHVDSLLGGSGTSRNQPETILANLPYVEYLFIGNKKHLTLVHPSHLPGTLKEVSPQQKIEIVRKLEAGSSKNPAVPTVVILTTDSARAAAELESATGMRLQGVEPGVYSLETGTAVICLKTIEPGLGQPQPGTYFVQKKSIHDQAGIRVEIRGKIYLAVAAHGLNILLDES